MMMTLSHDRPCPEKKKGVTHVLLRMKVRLSPKRITGSLYRRRPDMSTSAGMPAQPAVCPGCGKTFTQGDAGAEYVIISKEHCMAAMRWNWYLKTAAMRRL